MGPLTTFNPKAAIPEPARRFRSGSFDFKNAIQLDGINDTAFTNAFAVQPIVDFSISTWFRPVSFAVARGFLSTNRGVNTNMVSYYTGGLANSNLVVRINDSTGVQIQDTVTLSLLINTWYHLVSRGNFITKMVETFLDGTLIDIRSVPNWFGNYGGFGVDRSIPSASLWQGQRDETVFWKRAILDNEVDTYYNRGIGSNAYNITDLAGYWRFDETGSPATAADSSGNGNNMSLLNGPTFVPH